MELIHKLKRLLNNTKNKYFAKKCNKGGLFPAKGSERTPVPYGINFTIHKLFDIHNIIQKKFPEKIGRVWRKGSQKEVRIVSDLITC